MNVDVVASKDVNSQGEGKFSSCVGLTPDAFPEVQKPLLVEGSDTGVSTENALSGTTGHQSKQGTSHSHWYALRTTYGREKKAYDFIVGQGATAFYPTLTTVKLVGGKRETIEESRIPNIFFAYGTEEEIKSFVYDNVNLPYLRFYYRHFHFGNEIRKEPLIVPDNQIESLRIICDSDVDDIVVSTDDVPKFRSGQVVRIIKGKFKGVIGTVARYQGQQRVGVVINGLLTVATAYIPNAFIAPVD